MRVLENPEGYLPTPFDPAVEAILSFAAGSIEETRFAERIRTHLRAAADER